MKTLSLTQPWATLMALGEKHIETRSWSTNYRGQLLIHASKGFPVDCRHLCSAGPFAEALERHGIKSWRELPTGVIIARVELYSCVGTWWLTSPDSEPGNKEWASCKAEFEYDFGDYSKRRYGWLTRNPQRLTPTPARGSLGLWGYIGDEIAPLVTP
jgi:hypothetical protein